MFNIDLLYMKHLESDRLMLHLPYILYNLFWEPKKIHPGGKEQNLSKTWLLFVIFVNDFYSKLHHLNTKMNSYLCIRSSLSNSSGNFRSPMKTVTLTETFISIYIYNYKVRKYGRIKTLTNPKDRQDLQSDPVYKLSM